jgi:hypothetical protein
MAKKMRYPATAKFDISILWKEKWPAALLAKAIEAKPQTPLSKVMSEGSIVMYLSLWRRTRLSSFRLFEFSFFCFGILSFVFYEYRQARFDFVAYGDETLYIVSHRQIQFGP